MKFKPLLFRATLFFLPIVFLVLCEMGARQFFVLRSSRNDPVYRLDVQSDRINEFISVIERDRSPDEFRVLVTGGSVAYGAGVASEDKTFPFQLEKILRERFPSRKIEVFNGGVHGFTATDELGFYVKFLRKLKPDVIVMLTGHNDIWGIVRNQMEPDRYKQVREIGGIGYYDTKDSFGLFRLTVTSVFFQMHTWMDRHSVLYQGMMDWRRRLDYVPVLNLTAVEKERTRRDLQTFVDAVECFYHLAHRERIPFVVAIQPIKSFNSLPFTEHPISRFEAKLRFFYDTYILPELRKFISSGGFYLLDLNGTFCSGLIKKDAFLDYCHLNEDGYRMMADRVANFLLENRLIAAKSTPSH